MPESLVAVRIVEYLGGYRSEAELFWNVGVFPNIDEHDGGSSVIFVGQLLDDRRHHFARNAFVSP